jgi:hypothetical protein
VNRRGNLEDVLVFFRARNEASLLFAVQFLEFKTCSWSTSRPINGTNNPGIDILEYDSQGESLSRLGNRVG